jgi:hypothetical protein
LDLSYCEKLSDKGIASLNSCGKNKMTALTHLNLEGLTALTDAAFVKLDKHMTSLVELRLKGAGTSGAMLAGVAGLTVVGK